MKANKVTVTIVVEALSIDAVHGLVGEAIDNINQEYVNGNLAADDGDTVTWTTVSQEVEF